MKFSVCFLLLFFYSSLASGQESQPAPVQPTPPVVTHRPSIGLVLEGGGALGLAHIGVLRWFEEHHIPVDYIAGTSMGGLVGGFYATGMSGDEIDKFMEGINWNRSLRNELPYLARSFRRKEDKRDYPNDLEFGLKHGISFPSGFNSGQQVGLILDRVALPYSDLKTFDDLPTPFRCVATDLVSGKARVFTGGSLSEALRATMSLPAIFSPVRRDGEIYVDGGLLDNLPVDVARAMGADIIIAVHLETPPIKAEQSLSAFTVLESSIDVVIAANELESMQKADVLIPVHTEAYSILDFQAAKKIVDQLVALANTRYFPGEQIAGAYATLGDKDEAFRWLDRAMNERSGPVHAIAQSPEYRSLRDDPRFTQALERIGLDPAQVRRGWK